MENRSRVIKEGYINIYSQLSPQELRQIKFKERYKNENPNWDDTLVFLSGWFRDFAEQNPHKKIKVLDAGCGNGNYVIDENKDLITQAIGVDVAEEFTRNNICLDKILIADLNDLPFENETFDIVISLWVMEHIKNPKKVFSEINRVLKRGGVFMFAAPNKYYFPLLFINGLKLNKVNTILNKYLFGRKEEDIFETYYLANTKREVRKFIKDYFEPVVIKYNYDPSYLSFNFVTYTISNLIHNICSLMGLKTTFPHIISVSKKI